MQRTIIILSGPMACGKTVLARLLTHEGQTGIYFDVRSDGICTATKSAINQMLRCPRVVICAEFSNSARANPDLQELFKGARTLVINVSPGDGTAIIPTSSLASPPAFREWLLSFGNNTFEGGQRELNRIIEQLPPYASVADLRKLSMFSGLRMAKAYAAPADISGA